MDNQKPTLVVAIDCERNGLRGQFLSIGIVAERIGAHFELTVDTTDMLLDPWVEANVVPHLGPSNCVTELDMLERFGAWWLYHTSKYNVVLIGHMMCPVETDLFTKMYEVQAIGTFDGPYRMFDIATILMYNGFAHDQLDKFLEDAGYTFPLASHSAVGDAKRVMTAWEHFNCNALV